MRLSLRKAITSGVISALLSFIGCAPIDYQRPLTAAAPVSPSAAVVYGQFRLERDFLNKMRLALQLSNTATNEIRSIRFSDGEPVYAIELPPGTYKILEIVYAPVGAVAFEVKHMPLPTDAAYLETPFVVEPGRAYYLGDFVGTSRRTGFGMTDSTVWASFEGNLLGVTQSFASTTEAIKELRPYLSAMKFEPVFKQ